MPESGYKDEPLTKEQLESLEKARRNERRRDLTNKIVVGIIVAFVVLAFIITLIAYFRQ